MKNLKAQLKRDEKQTFKNNIESLNDFNTIEELLNQWRFKDIIPVSSKNKKWSSANELKEYLKARYKKRYEARTIKGLERIETIKNSLEIEKIVITVDWNKSRTWGNNAQAEIKVFLKNGLCEYFKGSRTSGCGYDKESTAISDALNQCNGLLKLLYKVKNKDVNKSNRDLIGYGSGYGLLPSFEGGVGVSCMYRICESINMKFKNIANGKNFDVYEITK